MCRIIRSSLCLALTLAAGARISSQSAAQELRQCHLPMVSRGPELTGTLADPAWQQAAVLDSFTLLDGKGMPQAPTEARLLADERHLYVGFVCQEPNMGQLVAEVTQQGGSVWSDDCVEIMVDPTNGKAFQHHLIINSREVLWQGFHSSVGSLPHPEGTVTVSTATAPDRWTCEVSIPFTMLGATPRPGEIWGFNVGRERKAGLAEVSSWQNATSFTDPTQLGRAHVPSPEEPVGIKVENRGGVSPLFNERDVNRFDVLVHNRGANALPLRLLVVTDDSPVASSETVVPARSEERLSLQYEVPADSGGRIFFRAYAGATLAYETSLQILQPRERPARTWVLEDPLFEELVGTEPPGWARDGAMMWTHMFNNANLLRETAKRFAIRYSLEEAYEEFGRHGLIPVGGGLVSGERAEMYARYGIRNLAYSKNLPKDIPWVLDPRGIDHFCTVLEDLVTTPHPHLWGVFAGDELDERAIREGIRLKADPPENYDFIRQADEEVKNRFGGGKWGIPESMDDRNPYRWIAYHKWVLERLRERHRRMHQIVKTHDPNLALVGTDPVSGVHGYEFSLQGPYFDIFTHQHLPRQNRWRQYLGFLSKLLADTTGKEAWPCAHVENYGMATTPQEAIEELSQVLRNGGHGFHLYMPDTANGNAIVGDTRVTAFGSPPRHQTVMNIVDRTRTLPRLKYPEYQRTAIVYNDDCLQSAHRTTRTHWYLTESCYTFVGPMARSWFRFIDVPQVLNLPSLREAFDIIFLPTAIYQQPAVVARLREFVEAGGTLVCGDPNAFQHDTIGNDTSALRTALFGVEVGARIKPARMSTAVGGRDFDLGVHGAAFALTPVGADTRVLARFDTGEPALTEQPAGQGRAIFFAANPFQFKGNEEAAWREFFTAWIHDLGAPVGLDIWRFQYPANMIPTPKKRTDYCLTNNNVEWREETPWFPRNLNSGGSYTCTPRPDAWDDQTDGESVPFAQGKLTDRRQSINAEKTEARWYAPYKLPAREWALRWERPQGLTITLDLNETHQATETTLWFSDTLPAMTVHGSQDGHQWQELGRSDAHEAGTDVLDLTIPLQGNAPVRYLRLAFAENQQAPPLTLVEMEVWGNPPEPGAER